MDRHLFGFKKECGARDSIEFMRILSEQCIENNKDLIVC